MPLANTTASYGSVARALHWLTALLILAAVALALYMQGLPQGTDAEVARVSALYSVHKTIGLAAFATAIVRILWALIQPKPAALHPERRAETFAAEAVHWSLYAAMVVMPVSGWLFHAATDGFAPILWPFGQSLPFVPKSPALAMTFRAIHGLSAKLLYASFALHVLGALKHGLIDRDGTMGRMISGRALSAGPRPSPSRWPALAALVLWAALVSVPVALPPPAARPAAPAPAAAGGNWTVSQGTLAITVRQSQAAIPGSITGWSAAIAYDDQARTGT
ncbi:MAG: cytochrome b, partial [Proteobacteria bacterium]|nr:cytochrome b [Pseudomonadota bacterium]